MKRGKPPERRTPLGRGKPLERGTPPQRKRARLAPVSARTAAARDARAVVREVVHRRDRGCRGPAAGAPGPCGGRLDVDEVVLRSGYSRAQYRVDLCQLLCRLHHDWKHAHPQEAARLGLRCWSWDVRVRPPYTVRVELPGGSVEHAADTEAQVWEAVARLAQVVPLEGVWEVVPGATP